MYLVPAVSPNYGTENPVVDKIEFFSSWRYIKKICLWPTGVTWDLIGLSLWVWNLWSYGSLGHRICNRAPLVRISGKWEDSRNIRKKNKEDKTGEEDRGKERKQSREAMKHQPRCMVQCIGTWLSVNFNNDVPFITLETCVVFLQMKIFNNWKNA